MEGMEQKRGQRICERFPKKYHLSLWLSSHWPELSHMATDSHMGVWEVFLLTEVLLLWKKGRKVLVDNMQSLPRLAKLAESL